MCKEPMKSLACLLTTVLLYITMMPTMHARANLLAGSAQAAAQSNPKEVVTPSCPTKQLHLPLIRSDVRSDNFVTRSGSTLQLHGKPFRFGGANIYWLGLDENVGGVDYPTYFRVDDALETARAMGATVVRSHLGISTGCDRCVEPELGVFNETALRRIDYAIKASADHDLRLIIPLTDNWHYYHGGKHDFTDWRGIGDEQQFYTNTTVIEDFKQYIDVIVNRVNIYTGVAYKNDPTIMAWELGNELNGMPASWINDIAGHIHQQAPRQLIAAGQQSGINPSTLSASAVDIVDVHYYPPSVERIRADAEVVTRAGKVYIAGEYASTAASDSLFAPLIADPQVSGALFWSLFAHNDTYGYVQHNDGFTLHYPGDTPQMREQVQAIIRFNRAMNPQAAPYPSRPGTPLITSIVKKYGENIYMLGNLSGASYLKVAWNNSSGQPYTPQIARVQLYGPGQPPAPSSFEQLTPAAGATGVSTRPQFTWSPASNAAYYSLVVSTRPDLSDPAIAVAGVQAVCYAPVSKLAPGTTYYWRITATNTTGTTAAPNAGASFTTATISPPPLVVEDFDAYCSNAALQAAYRANPNGDPISVSLDSTHTDGSPHSMAANYTLGTKGYAGVIHDFPARQSWQGYDGIRFWLEPDGSGRSITIQFVASGIYWEASFTPSGTTPRVVELPFSNFRTPDWAEDGPLNLESVSQFSIYVNGAAGSGTLFFDTFEVYPGS